MNGRGGCYRRWENLLTLRDQLSVCSCSGASVLRGDDAEEVSETALIEPPHQAI